MELLRWEGEDLSPDRDGTIMKSIITHGKKFNNPTEHAGVKLHAVGSTLDGRVFYNRHLEFNLNEGTEQCLPSGVDMFAFKNYSDGLM